jgi:hypothetical protein
MKTIEQHLDETAEMIRELSKEVPNRRWVEPRGRTRSRVLVAVAAAALVLVAIGLPALFMTGDDPSDVADGAAPSQNTETTIATIATTLGDTVADSRPVDVEEPSAPEEMTLDGLLSVLPEGFELDSATPIFSGTGDPNEVATRYLEDRFPDALSLGVGVESSSASSSWLLLRWAWSSIEESGAAGYLVLLEHDGVVDVLAATTDGVDLSGLGLVDGRLSGTIATTNTVGGLGADVLDINGQPVAGSPYPEGVSPDSAFRWGTAGYSDQGPLAIDISPITEPVTVRVNLVGGTLLSISEVGFSPTG